MNFDILQSTLTALGEPAFRVKQLVQSVSKGAVSYTEVKGWPNQLKEVVSSKTHFISWNNSEVFISKDGTVKAILKLLDGQTVETVLMEPKPGHLSICVSSEVGCPMNCAFCATGALGFFRRLTLEEITDQVLFWTHYCAENNPGKAIQSIVFMGMGEPFHNQEAVFDAVNVLHTKYNFGMRHLSISTCGLPDGIKALAQHYPQVNLAISLHAADELLRAQLMPVSKAHNLDDLKLALLSYLKTTRRQLMFEYILLDSVNDRPEDQIKLKQWLSDFPLKLVHVNLIRYNQTYRGFNPTSVGKVKQWKQWLLGHGISASIRKNLGEDIAGACGQLAAKRIL